MFLFNGKTNKGSGKKGFTSTSFVTVLHEGFVRKDKTFSNLKPNSLQLKANKGFTLIELLVVIAIIGMLSSVVLASLNSARAKARDARRIADLKQMSTALEFFYDQQGRYPTSSGGTCWDLCTSTSHWQYFKNCLSLGQNCGFSLSNYNPVMPSVPDDPLDDPSVSQGSSGYVYTTGWDGSRGSDRYLLRTRLENTDNSALDSDSDGGWRNASDGGCNDPWYCIKVGVPF
ncbi:MAG: hypothetical protein COV70_01320 [Parcubacteria group bacterium CG11_big_fil_rev_8_21_14_0_20_39_22]|nr:MAG: hypothetical protein COV70_01320 [Parcubacteria group bacterium CG11_big_fil_rev_8_21_14_0_20_39_22]